MKTTIKTFLAAGFASVLLVGCETHIGAAASCCDATGDKKCASKMAGCESNQVGRYQISGLNSPAGDHWLMIDTVTGQVWRTYIAPTDGTPDVDFYKAKSPDKK